jgi:hypothetical protein
LRGTTQSRRVKDSSATLRAQIAQAGTITRRVASLRISRGAIEIAASTSSPPFGTLTPNRFTYQALPLQAAFAGRSRSSTGKTHAYYCRRQAQDSVPAAKVGRDPMRVQLRVNSPDVHGLGHPADAQHVRRNTHRHVAVDVNFQHVAESDLHHLL